MDESTQKGKKIAISGSPPVLPTRPPKPSSYYSTLMDWLSKQIDLLTENPNTTLDSSWTLATYIILRENARLLDNVWMVFGDVWKRANGLQAQIDTEVTTTARTIDAFGEFVDHYTSLLEQLEQERGFRGNIGNVHQP
jgi:hypothetical protein